jgi:hypothetical protein
LGLLGYPHSPILGDLLVLEDLDVVCQIFGRGLVDRDCHALEAGSVDERDVCLVLAVAQLRLDRKAAPDRL